MFNVLIGIIVGCIAKTWIQLAGATVIVVAVLTTRESPRFIM